MIINVGGRTDIVQYFTPWLLKRFAEGYVYVRNPLFPRKVTRYALTPDKVDCVAFCSKNYAPLLKALPQITERFATYFHYTITAYGKDIEPGVPAIDQSIETLKALSAQVGRERIAWRYDPVLVTAPYSVDRHLDTFAAMAKALTPYVDRCIFSFVSMYKKVEVNMPRLRPVSKAQQVQLARGLGAIARAEGLHLQICGTHEDWSDYGIHSAGCMTLDILGRANHLVFKQLKHRGMREGCHCIESRDIGAYDTCMNGCQYCYANRTPVKAFANYKYHDPDSPLLLGHLQEGDELTDAEQKSFLIESHGEQLCLDI